MSTQKPISIGKILEQVGISEHARLALQIRQRAELERHILGLLPADLAPHCHLAGLDDGILRLTTQSPAWAARLRFQSARLIQQLKQRGDLKVRNVQVRILPPGVPQPRAHRQLGLSTDNARLLEQTAAGMRDPGLAEALLRLARRVKPGLG